FVILLICIYVPFFLFYVIASSRLSLWYHSYFLLSFLLCSDSSSSLFPYTTLFRSSSLLRSRASVESRVRRRPCTARAVRTGCRADRKSTRLNSSHVKTSYAVFCLQKK